MFVWKDQLGADKGIRKLLKFDRNELRFYFHCGILIPRKCPHKTPFKAQWGRGGEGGGAGPHLPHGSDRPGL